MKNRKTPIKNFINEIKKKGKPIITIDIENEFKDLKECTEHSVLFNSFTERK